MGVVLVAALLSLGTWALRASARGVRTVDASALTLDTATRGQLVREVEAPGVLEAESAEWLSASQPARVARITHKAGEEVRAHDVVLVLDNPDLELLALDAELRLAAARADVARLRADLGEAKAARASTLATLTALTTEATRRRAQATRLADEKLGEQADVWSWQAREDDASRRLALETERQAAHPRERGREIEARAAQIATLERMVTFRRAQVAALEIRSPIDGVLLSLAVEPGQWIPAGTALARLAPKERLRAALSVSEVSARDVAPGQVARVDTRNGIVKGRVARIDPAAKAGTVRVEIAFDEPAPRGARADARVDAVIETERLVDAIAVRRPVGAPPSGPTTLYRLGADGVLARARVTLAAGTATHAVVTSGLVPGDRVVVSDTTTLESAEAWRVR